MKASLVAASCLLLAASPALAGQGWTVAKTAEGQVLTYDGFADKGVGYAFRCTGETLIATETGVTDLMNVADGQRIADAPGTTMPAGSAVMTLFTDKTKPDFMQAEAKANPRLGWDLTLTLPLNHAAVRALPKAKAVSLMTTGWTGLVELDGKDREVIAGFLKGCKAKG